MLVAGGALLALFRPLRVLFWLVALGALLAPFWIRLAPLWAFSGANFRLQPVFSRPAGGTVAAGNRDRPFDAQGRWIWQFWLIFGGSKNR